MFQVIMISKIISSHFIYLIYKLTNSTSLPKTNKQRNFVFWANYSSSFQSISPPQLLSFWELAKKKCVVLILKQARCVFLNIDANNVNPHQHLISPYAIKTLLSKPVLRMKTDHKLTDLILMCLKFFELTLIDLSAIQ